MNIYRCFRAYFNKKNCIQFEMKQNFYLGWRNVAFYFGTGFV